jgi:hypothetical protein
MGDQSSQRKGTKAKEDMIASTLSGIRSAMISRPLVPGFDGDQNALG